MMKQCFVVGTMELVLALVACLELLRKEYVARFLHETGDGRSIVTRVWPSDIQTHYHARSTADAKKALTDGWEEADVAFVAFPEQPELAASFTQFFVDKGLRVFLWPQDLVAGVDGVAAYTVFNAAQALAAESN